VVAHAGRVATLADRLDDDADGAWPHFLYVEHARDANQGLPLASRIVGTGPGALPN
jgi:hypothetical protein